MNYSPGNVDIPILIYVCFTAVEIMCLRSVILSPQGITFRVPISNISALLTKRLLLRNSTFSFILRQEKGQVPEKMFVPNGV